MRIEVIPYPDQFGDFECPLKGDVGNCQAIPHSSTNYCPKTGDDENGNFVQRLPDGCPLLSGDIVVSLNKEKSRKEITHCATLDQ